jgi:hypothetical protein
MTSATDPHGFHDMSAREIIDWFAESGAQPGSITYQYAEKILRLKEREAEEDARSYERAMRSADEFMEELKADTSESSSRGQLSEAHIAILAFPFAVFAAVFAATGSVLWSIAAAALAVGLLFVRPVRDRAARLLGRVVR